MESTGRKHVINFTQMQDFMVKSYGCSDIIQLSHQYTSDLNGLIKMIEDIYPYLNSRATKARLTRIKKKLSNDFDSDSSHLSEEESETEINQTESAGKKDLETLLKPIKQKIVDDPKWPLDYNSFKSFIDKASSNPLAAQIAKEFVEETDSIAKMMRELYPSLEQRNIKNQFSRIIKKIELSNQI